MAEKPNHILMTGSNSECAVSIHEKLFIQAFKQESILIFEDTRLGVDEALAKQLSLISNREKDLTVIDSVAELRRIPVDNLKKDGRIVFVRFSKEDVLEYLSGALSQELTPGGPGLTIFLGLILPNNAELATQVFSKSVFCKGLTLIGVSKNLKRKHFEPLRACSRTLINHSLV